MKINKFVAAVAIAGAMVSSSALASLQDLTTWTTATGVNGSVSVGPASATLSGTASISKSFSLAAGALFSFNWFFDANDYLPYNDWAQTIVDGNLNFTLSNVAAVGNYNASGWQTYSTTLLNPVNGNITFSVNNYGDNALNSTLTVSNVDVPEPGIMAMFMTGLALLGFAGRRSRKA